MKIAVVGGGISGLVTAHRLMREGHDVVCFEADRPGGLLRTEKRDGFLCEVGPQGILDGSPEVKKLLAELGLTSIPSSPAARSRYVFVKRKLRRVPTGPLSLLTSDLLSASGKWRLMREPKVPPRTMEPDEDESVLDFAIRRAGPEVAALVTPAVLGIFAGDAAVLSLRSAFPKVASLETEHGSVLRGIESTRRTAASSGTLVSFAEGIEELPRALARRLGDRLVTTRVQNLRREGSQWRLDGHTADVVVLAVGPRAAAALVPEAAALREIPLASVAVVCLGFRHAAIGMKLDAYGFLVARGEPPTILGCQYDSSVFPGRAPKGGVLLRVILGGTFDPRLVDRDDRALIDHAVGDLRLAAGLTAVPAFAAVWRHRDVIPQYHLGHERRARAIEAALPPGLHLLGMSLRGVGISDAIRNAEALKVAAASGP